MTLTYFPRGKNIRTGCGSDSEIEMTSCFFFLSVCMRSSAIVVEIAIRCWTLSRKEQNKPQSNIYLQHIDLKDGH